MNFVFELQFFEQLNSSFSDRVQLSIKYFDSGPGFMQAGDGGSQLVQVF